MPVEALEGMLDGIEATAYANQSFEGGGESYRLNAAWGKTFDRGTAFCGEDGSTLVENR